MTPAQQRTKAAVTRLLAQYQEYQLLDAAATEAKSSYEKRLLERAKEQRVSLREILNTDAQIDETLRLYDGQRRQYEQMRDRVADEMTFATPEIWMRYKALAYKGTIQEIATWEDFMQHCSPPGYICTKRYAFLRRTAQEKLHVTLDGLSKDTPLLAMCGAPWLEELQSDHDVISEWQLHEFFMKNDRVAKWQDVT